MSALRLLVPVLMVSLSACGPIPVEQAEKECLNQARAARAPTGEISAGVTSDGNAVGGVEVNISSDFLLGRDPSAVFDRCVVNRSGKLPSRPLALQPGWPR
jgi:hypothetical protein